MTIGSQDKKAEKKEKKALKEAEKKEKDAIPSETNGDVPDAQKPVTAKASESALGLCAMSACLYRRRRKRK